VREGFGWLRLLVRWIWRYPTQKRPVIEAAIADHARAGTEVIRLRSRGEVVAFVDRVSHTAGVGLSVDPNDPRDR
jgi:hypothetical protein